MSDLSRKQVALINSLYTRHGRKKNALCIAEGVRCCRELILNRPDLIRFIVCSHDFDAFDLPGCEIYRVSESDLKSFSATVAPQGILIVAEYPTNDFTSPPEDPFILVLDRISDPGNFGTIIRSAMAVGLKEIWYTAGAVDPFNDKVIRSAMGGQFSVHLRRFHTLEELELKLKEFGYNRIYRTDVNEGSSCFKERALFDKTAIIMGSEAEGAALLKGSFQLTIPMPGDAESLNVAQAATVILFEYVRRKEM